MTSEGQFLARFPISSSWNGMPLFSKRFTFQLVRKREDEARMESRETGASKYRNNLCHFFSCDTDPDWRILWISDLPPGAEDAASGFSRIFFSSQIFKDFRGRSRTFEGSPLLTFISIELLGKSAHGRTIFKEQLRNGNITGKFSDKNRMVNGNRLYSYYSGILGRISSVK